MHPLVWVVDDSPLDLDRAVGALAGKCEVRVFPDGSSMLEHLAAGQPPDVLVLDWVMPGVSGIEVVRFLRSDLRFSMLPALLLTSRNDPQQIVEGLDAGANDYLAKPYADQELRARVDALVRTANLLDRAHRAEESVRALLAYAPDALLVIDAQGVVTYANEEAERAFGGGGAKVTGRRLSDILPELALRNISIGPGAPLLPLPDVSHGEYVYSPTVRILPTDTAARTTVALRDVTERRRMEARRLDFYSGLAHDLRSPLNAMLLRVDLLLKGRRGTLSAEVVRDLQRFDGSIRSMMKMIKDFLDLARMEGAGYKIDKDPLDLGALVSSIVDEVRPVVDANRIALEWAPPKRALPVLGDRHRLAQVLTNLLGNAIKFTPLGGRIDVGVRAADGRYEVTVADTGAGIASEALPTLFDRFTRAPGAATVAPGWGLGLMIVREIVEAHGGNVGVRSEVGRGSTFWFMLPAATPPRDEASA